MPVQAKPPAKKQRRPPSPEEEPSPPPESTPEVESEEETFNPDKTEESQPEDKAESSSLETEDDEAFEPGNAAETLASLTGRERPSRQPTSEPATGGGRKKRSSIKGAKYFAEEYEASPDGSRYRYSVSLNSCVHTLPRPQACLKADQIQLKPQQMRQHVFGPGNF